jgi:hypothetical protein
MIMPGPAFADFDGVEPFAKALLWRCRNPLVEAAYLSSCPVALIEAEIQLAETCAFAGHAAAGLCSAVKRVEGTVLCSPALYSHGDEGASGSRIHPLGLAEALPAVDALVLCNRDWAALLAVADGEFHTLASRIGRVFVAPYQLSARRIRTRWTTDFDGAESNEAGTALWRWCTTPDGKALGFIDLDGSVAVSATLSMTVTKAAAEAGRLSIDIGGASHLIEVAGDAPVMLSVQLRPGANRIVWNWSGGMLTAEAVGRNLSFAIVNLAIHPADGEPVDAGAAMQGDPSEEHHPLDLPALRGLLHGAGFAEVIACQTSDQGHVASHAASRMGLDQRFLFDPANPQERPNDGLADDRTTWIVARRLPGAPGGA